MAPRVAHAETNHTPRTEFEGFPEDLPLIRSDNLFKVTLPFVGKTVPDSMPICLSKGQFDRKKFTSPGDQFHVFSQRRRQ